MRLKLTITTGRMFDNINPDQANESITKRESKATGKSKKETKKKLCTVTDIKWFIWSMDSKRISNLFS